MAYKHVIRAKTRNLFNVNSEWERVIAPLTAVNLSIEGNTISGEDLADGASAIISPTKIPISTNKVYYTSGQCSGDHSILVRLTDESGEVLTTGIAETYYPYNQYYKAFIVYLNGTFSITNDNAKYLQLGLRFAKGTSTSTRVTFTNVQIEEGSTPTPYTPYNYLSSNKRMIKVSDVCQIVDKSQLITEQRNTVSLTNNGDGSISLTGAATDYEWVPITQISNRKIIKDHVYLLGGNSYKNSLVAMYGMCILSTGNQDFGYFSYNNEWVRFISNYTGYFQIMLQMRDVILDNFKITPQLFDLTEMFGAGHEPATVAEFRQRFPNELYPYSPQCWLTSYKSAVVCKTKNLFDVNNAVVINYNSLQETTDATHYVKDGIVYTDWNNAHIGTCVGIKGGWTLPAGTYTMSVKIAYNTKRHDEDSYRGGSIGFVCVLADGSKTRYTKYYVYLNPGERFTYTAEIPAGCKNIMLYCSVSSDAHVTSCPAAYCELMVEQGSTATSYVPYQHL